MTAHCSTCSCKSDPIPPPATSSRWARRAAIQAAKEAVDEARRKRTAKAGEAK